MDITYKKEMFNNGNYFYSKHSFEGDVCIVVDTIPCNNKTEQEQAEEYIKDKADSLNQEYKERKPSSNPVDRLLSTWFRRR